MCLPPTPVPTPAVTIFDERTGAAVYPNGRVNVRAGLPKEFWRTTNRLRYAAVCKNCGAPNPDVLPSCSYCLSSL